MIYNCKSFATHTHAHTTRAHAYFTRTRFFGPTVLQGRVHIYYGVYNRVVFYCYYRTGVVSAPLTGFRLSDVTQFPGSTKIAAVPAPGRVYMAIVPGRRPHYDLSSE